VLRIVEAYDDRLARFNPAGDVSSVPRVSAADAEVLLAAFDHMYDALFAEAPRRRYGATPSDESVLRGLHAGGDVPSYFANVGGESIFYRKGLSVAGLRNLVTQGPVIFQQLRARLFASDPNAYRGDVGLALMRRVTGNVVDLDSVVLRCTDAPTLAAINASNKHKGLPTHASIHDFADSDQAREIAVACATMALEDFGRLFRLSQAEAEARQVAPSQIPARGAIPVASSNTERGRWPLWRYINAGQNSYHANVPSLDDVIGALLRAPFHCARHYAFLHLRDGERADMGRFFEDCVVDSCFNMKWKAIEEFGHNLAHEGTIVHVLQLLQVRHQAVFAPIIAADDDTHIGEETEMLRLVRAEQPYGFDAKGRLRAITVDDVKRWVADPSIKI
jgi:hypothetical protein